MEKSTAELTGEYIKEHPYIKNCLKKGLINYSSLARVIAKDLGIEKKTSKEAILIAARRFREKIKADSAYENKVKDLLAESEIEIRNKVNVFILEKGINLDYIDDIQKMTRLEFGVFYILEGSESYTIIIQEKNSKLVEERFKTKIIKCNKDTILIKIKSSKEIEKTCGFVSYLTSLFAENGVNIIEFLSCWTDTLFIIDSKDLNRTINFLKF